MKIIFKPYDLVRHKIRKSKLMIILSVKKEQLLSLGQKEANIFVTCRYYNNITGKFTEQTFIQSELEKAGVK